MPPKRIALLTGFSGAGKTTLWKELAALYPDQLKRVITYTTRNPRPGEVPGVDYHFITPEEFHQKNEQGHFLESSEHYGHHYAAPTVDHLDVEEHHVPMYVIDPKGGLAVKDHYPQTEAFFLYVSPEEQYRRLTERGNTDPELVKKRLERYQHEQEILEKNRHLYHILRNEEPDDLKKAMEHFRQTVQLG
jgi:guanylate kinase